MLYKPKKVPRNWYNFDVRFSIELLRSYIERVEDQIGKSIEEFRSGYEVQASRIEDDLEADQFEVDIVIIHGGLESDSWDLEDIFGKHFPGLQRRSALITLYSFLEHELNQLCELFVKHQKLMVSLNDIRGRGIDRAFLFLEKVVGLQINKSTDLWQEVTNIRELRNCIVHDDARLKNRSGQATNIAKYVKDCPYLSGQSEIEISEGYLAHVLDIFDRQFQQIDELIAVLPRVS